MPLYIQNENAITAKPRPTRAEAEAAVRLLIEYAGDDPTREGLIDTPARVVRSYDEFFSGYGENPNAILSRTFSDVGGYSDMVMLKRIRVESYCEHHIAPILGYASVAYVPRDRVVGISKLARVIEIFAKRLQTQETMTAQIVNAIQNSLNPKGVAIVIDATHQCMTTRGIHKTDASMVTNGFTGIFNDDENLRNRFLKDAA